MRERPPDPHAVRREEKRKKARHGMRVTGAGTRLLARLLLRQDAPVRRRGVRKKKTG